MEFHWFDLINGVKVDERYRLVNVKPKLRLNSNEPFVLLHRAQQVYYTIYPQNRGSRDWCPAFGFYTILVKKHNQKLLGSDTI